MKSKQNSKIVKQYSRPRMTSLIYFLAVSSESGGSFFFMIAPPERYSRTRLKNN